MPVITEEEMGSNVLASDFSQLLDLPDTTIEPLELAQVDPDSTDPFVNGMTIEWDLPQPATDPYLGLEEPDYGKFENWIPQFIRPEKPCDYCRAKRLNCYITRGEITCTPCNALFRECSLTNTRTLEGLNQSTGHLLDTLHVVDEDTAKEQGTLTGIKTLSSKVSTGVRLDDAPGSSKRNGIRFPKHAVKTLRDWLDAHADNPYPTEEEKAELEKKTELKPRQIADWLANARRRRKVVEKARPRLCSSPSLKPSTPAIDIPSGPEKAWDELNPFERWKNSPPEHEPASITDIANAVANTEPLDDSPTSPSSFGKYKRSSKDSSGRSNHRAPSTTSFETGKSSSLSNSTAWSHGSSHSYGSFGSFSSSLAGKRDRRRRRKPTTAPARKLGEEKKRIFQCTFCTDTFKSKYDWTRHEKSLHLSLEKWICAPLGPIITDPKTGNKRCVYCDELNPSKDHVEGHNHRQCEDKGLDARTFYRKDHLRQHLRLMHNCEMTPFMDNWKSIAVNINSRCGFCSQRFTVWQERVDHLTAHFKAGARMSEWKGCRGLDPAVAAQVTNAMPPYLIGMESVSPNPFSASNKATWRQNLQASEAGSEADTGAAGWSAACPAHEYEPESSELAGFGSKATCWEILTVRLGKYANDTAKQGIVLTDDLLQTAAREILYGSDDTWNQTAADNPEWLDLFKKAHGLDFIPNDIGGQGPQVPEDLETYGDLGLRIPFSVQLQAYNDRQADEILCNCDTVTGQHTVPVHKKKAAEQLEYLCIQLAREGVLYDENGKCTHTECSSNQLEIGATEGNRVYRWCNYLPPARLEQIAKIKAISQQSRSNAQLENHSKVVQKQLQRGMDPLPLTPNSRGKLTRKPFLQRHRYELPKELAHHFETTTPAWEDSGIMPDTIFTSRPSIENQQSTTTGAMMEFLGGDVGQDLPFSSDAATSSIPLPTTTSNDLDWLIPTSAAQEANLMADIDKLIAETTRSPERHIGASDTVMPTTSSPFELPQDLVMGDLTNFHDDFDMTFDGVFDMPTDESFHFS